MAITAKCSDMCDISIFDDAVIIHKIEGYVPKGLAIGGGDYIDLLINVETGKICGWNAEKVKEAIKEATA